MKIRLTTTWMLTVLCGLAAGCQHSSNAATTGDEAHASDVATVSSFVYKCDARWLCLRQAALQVRGDILGPGPGTVPIQESTLDNDRADGSARLDILFYASTDRIVSSLIGVKGPRWSPNRLRPRAGSDVHTMTLRGQTVLATTTKEGSSLYWQENGWSWKVGCTSNNGGGDSLRAAVLEVRRLVVVHPQSEALPHKSPVGAASATPTTS